MTFGEKLKEIRKSKFLTQKEVAAVVGKTNTTVYDWESGKSMPNLTELVALADYFQVTTDFMLGRIHSYQPIDNFNRDYQSSKEHFSAVTLYKKYTKEDMEIVDKLLEIFYKELKEDSFFYQMFKRVGYRIDTDNDKKDSPDKK